MARRARARLRDAQVTRSFESLDAQMTTLMGAVSPSQIAKFLLWIERNQACMHMLTKIWQDGEAAALTEGSVAAAAEVTL